MDKSLKSGQWSSVLCARLEIDSGSVVVEVVHCHHCHAGCCGGAHGTRGYLHHGCHHHPWW